MYVPLDRRGSAIHQSGAARISRSLREPISLRHSPRKGKAGTLALDQPQSSHRSPRKRPTFPGRSCVNPGRTGAGRTERSPGEMSESVFPSAGATIPDTTRHPRLTTRCFLNRHRARLSPWQRISPFHIHSDLSSSKIGSIFVHCSCCRCAGLFSKRPKGLHSNRQHASVTRQDTPSRPREREPEP